MPVPELLHLIETRAFRVRVEKHEEAPEFRIAVRPTANDRWVQLELFEYRSHAADALELSRALYLASVLAAYLEGGGSVEHWSEEAALATSFF